MELLYIVLMCVGGAYIFTEVVFLLLTKLIYKIDKEVDSFVSDYEESEKSINNTYITSDPGDEIEHI